MKRVITLVVSLLIALISILIYNTPAAQNTLLNLVSQDQISFYQTAISSMLNVTRSAMSKSTSGAPAAALRHAKITPHKSSSRGHADHGWLNTYHSFSFANWYDPRYTHFGSLRVLNEDRVKSNTGFPTHPHSNFEIFSYILSGELTHRDSMLRKGHEGDAGADKFYRMHRGDVQFTTGGTGISHSEFNEHNSDTVHFLQIWALPWKKGLSPRYHTRHFDDEDKRKGFVTILSPLKAGPEATAAEEKEAAPAVEGTIPIHADFAMGAGLIAPEQTFTWKVGSQGTQATKRKVYVHVPMTKGGKAKVRLDGRDDAVLEEGDGAFVDGVNVGDKLNFESVGTAEAEVVVLDTE
ncbi:hypothetical protein PspLS_07966 [Pyricularia sp. CBS 133598]|nr:hypothetical protein PspLS_07966 [Pyricularia sp. CBS 133598]